MVSALPASIVKFNTRTESAAMPMLVHTWVTNPGDETLIS
jgi:hypothetical protein